jgi:tetratricopeptide (TPR) repeat protein
VSPAPGTGRRPAAPRVRSVSLLLAVLALGLALRLVYLAQIRSLPFFDAPIIDGAEYLSWARRILAGEILWKETPIHGPFYAYLLAALLAVSGGSLVFVVFVQLALGLLSGLLVHRIGRRVFGPAEGVVAAAIYVTHVTFVYFEGLILASGVAVLLNLLMLDRLLAMPARAPLRRYVLPGVLLGAAIATHPSAATLLAGVGAAIFAGIDRARRGGDGAPSRSRGARNAAAMFAAAALLVVVPVVARNAAVGGGPVLQRNVGKNFYIGMNPSADGTANVPPGAPWERLRRQAWTAGARSPAEESRYFLGEAWGFATRDPGGAAALIGKKVWLFVSGIHVDASQDYRFFRRNCSALRLPLPSPLVIIPLGLLGMFRFGRRAPLLLVVAACYLVSVTAFAFATRYALPAQPIFVLFAAAALVHVARAARARRVDSIDAALLGVFLLASNVDPFGLRDRQLLHTTGFVAKVYADAADAERALGYYDRAVREHPDDPDIRNGFATTLDRIGRPDDARAQYEAALAAAPDHFEATFNLASHAYEARRLEEAIAGYRRAIEVAPWRADTRLNLGAVYADMDSLDQAAAQFDTALALAPDFWEARMNLAAMESRRGAPQRAAEIYRRLYRERPSPDLAVSLGQALTESADYLGAQEAFRQALRSDPAHRAALFQLGMNVAGFQRFEEAIGIWQRLLEVDPANEVAATAIAEARARIAARDAAGDSAAAPNASGAAQPSQDP